MGNNFYFPAGTIGTMETKTHHLHRPIDRYLADKVGRSGAEFPAEQESPAEDEQALENAIFVKEREIRRLKEMVKAEQRKVKVCYECRRKFASAEQLRRHEESSQMHRENVGRGANHNQQQQQNPETKSELKPEEKKLDEAMAVVPPTSTAAEDIGEAPMDVEEKKS